MQGTAISKFITHWRNAGGGERSQSQKFLIHLCQALGLEEPMDGDYKFEFDVKGDKGRNFIDLYKRGAFVLESKQSRARRERSEFPNQQDLFPTEDDKRRDRSSRAWDVLMSNARAQAENYARHLPADHDWPPFIIVCDVGHCFELYADFTGKGRNYTQFPDRQNFRIYLDDLAKPEIQQLFRKIWDDPHALDPTRRAVRATRAIAERLAAVSKHMEQRKLPAEHVAAFLMRCIFTMFAEDVGLLPKDTFTSLLDRARERPHTFAPELQMLWQAMDRGDYASAVQDRVRRFNGQLFRDAPAYPLEREEIGELREAARQDWREVDPSIFGTLLEQALDPAERARLGAHYTPRAYVERLVVATVIEPLQEEWRKVLAAAERLTAAGDQKQAIAAVQAFHEKLYNTHVLDPACGTGNFLYVTLELMKRLEGDVIEALLNLGGQEALAGLDRHEVDPHQFLGLEVNARARHIAELVLWIGYLQWHIRNNRSLPGEPVLRDYRNIRTMDAVLAHDGVDAKGNYINPRRPEWPEADYIVGNPPFIGNKRMREALGDHYLEAVWTANRGFPESADFVMLWWHHSADLLNRTHTRLKRFGLVTTNSITQPFNRRIIEAHLVRKDPISIVYAIPDHPWGSDSRGAAAVRIAMTVAELGHSDGVLLKEVRRTRGRAPDKESEFVVDRGRINADLTLGANIGSSLHLASNSGLSHQGIIPVGEGFRLDQRELLSLGYNPDALPMEIRKYLIGKDLVQRPEQRFIIDMFGLTRDVARERHPRLWQIILERVKPQRDLVNRQKTKDCFWIFAEPRRLMRDALHSLSRYIVTCRTSKHRTFEFIDAVYLPDAKIVAIALDGAFELGVLSSHIHGVWSERAGGWHGIGNDPTYNHSDVFAKFPFPAADEFTRARIGSAAEKLHQHRKRVQGSQPEITLTQMYNVLEALKAEAELSVDEQRLRDDGLVLILKELHEELDAAVAQAYGWPVDLPEQELLARLVALNKQRAAEEAKGHVRWLRPDYQIPRFGSAAQKQEQLEADLGLAPAAATKQRLSFPSGAVEQTGAVMSALAAAAAPLSALDVALTFKQGRKVEPQVRATLAAMARMGFIAIHDAGTRFALRRAA